MMNEYPPPSPRPDMSVNPPEKFKLAVVGDFDSSILEQAWGWVRSAADGEMVYTPGFLIMGPVGTGKTHLAAALNNHVGGGEKLFASAVTWNEAIWAERKGKEYPPFPAEERFEADYPKNPRFYKEPYVYKPRTIMGRASEAAWVTIDDYGTEEFVANRKALYGIIDDRIATERPIVITTNLTWPEIKHTDERLHDRLRDLHCIVLDGKTRRGAKPDAVI